MLLAIEGIKKTKATYWYALDTKRWDLLKSVFTSDAIVDFRGGRDLKPGEDYSQLPPVEQALAQDDPTVATGNAAIVVFMQNGVKGWTTVHHGSAPIIDVLAPDQATAIWPMFDILDSGVHIQTGYGHYHETYRCQDETWRIQTLQVTRLRIDGNHPAHGARVKK